MQRRGSATEPRREERKRKATEIAEQAARDRRTSIPEREKAAATTKATAAEKMKTQVARKRETKAMKWKGGDRRCTNERFVLQSKEKQKEKEARKMRTSVIEGGAKAGKKGCGCGREAGAGTQIERRRVAALRGASSWRRRLRGLRGESPRGHEYVWRQQTKPADQAPAGEKRNVSKRWQSGQERMGMDAGGKRGRARRSGREECSSVARGE